MVGTWLRQARQQAAAAVEEDASRRVAELEKALRDSEATVSGPGRAVASAAAASAAAASAATSAAALGREGLGWDRGRGEGGGAERSGARGNGAD